MHIGIPLDYRWWQDWRVDKYVGASHDLPVVLSRLECNDWGNTLIFDTFTQGYTPQRNCCPHQARQWLCSETLTLTWSSGSNTPQRNRCLHQTRPWVWRDALMLTHPPGATLPGGISLIGECIHCSDNCMKWNIIDVHYFIVRTTNNSTKTNTLISVACDDFVLYE